MTSQLRRVIEGIATGDEAASHEGVYWLIMLFYD